MNIGVSEIVLIVVVLYLPIWLNALVDILKNEFRGSDKLAWLIALIFVPLFGLIFYLSIGRKQKIRA